LGIAVALAVLTMATKILTGFWATRKTRLGRLERFRAGLTLIPRGEFSIVIASLAAGFEPRFMSLAAAYVLLTAVLGPILVRLVK
jgi:monovalent cation:H+ antiporter-2, CPA2 family